MFALKESERHAPSIFRRCSRERPGQGVWSPLDAGLQIIPVGGGVKGILAEVFVQMKLLVPSGCNFQWLHRQFQTQRANFAVRLFRALSLTSFAGHATYFL